MSSSRSHKLCMTRAIKNIKYIQRLLPDTLKKKFLTEISKLPPKTLFNLQTLSNLQEVIRDKELANFLEKNRIPMPRASISSPLFNGTLVFVQITFNRRNQAPFSISSTDLQTAINYTNLAIIPIHRYVLQYGQNSINVSQNIIPFTATLNGDSFSDDDLQGFVKDIVRSNNLVNSCIMVLIDTAGPRNTHAIDGTLGYHSKTDNNIPYCFCNVFGQNLTIDDAANVYAQTLSHEIAEMVVDPRADISNPEVCDACAGNCANIQNDFFDSNNNFIGGSSTVPPSFSFNFFINGIIKLESYDPGTECAIKGSELTEVCIYAPPPLIDWSGPAVIATVPNIVSLSGHFSNADQRDVIIVGTISGKIHEIFWKSDTVGIEGEDDLPVSFDRNSIVAVSGFYNSSDQRHVVIVGTSDGNVHQIFWKSSTVGIEFHGIITNFGANNIIKLAGFYSENDQVEHVIVGTTDGKIHELWAP